MAEYSDHPYIEDLLKKGFTEFITTNIKPFPDHGDYVCHFVGSIAYFFIEQLREVCEQRGVKMGKVLSRPINELFNYIIQDRKSTRLNSSHVKISYAVFCLKKKKNKKTKTKNTPQNKDS